MAVPRTSLFLAVAVTAALALAGCSSSGSSGSASGAAGATSDGATGSAPAAAGAAGVGGGAEAKPPAGSQSSQEPQAQPGAAPAAIVKQRVVRTAQVVVQVDGELAPAAAKVRGIAQGLGGSVASETTTFADVGDPGTTTSGDHPSGTSGDGSSSPPAGSSSAPAAGSSSAAAAAGSTAAAKPAHPGQSLLVLRVPESSLDQALAQITGPAGVGRELSRSANAEDVTGDLADLQSRVATQRASVERIRALLGKAAALRDVVLLESEVTKREADLEALEARRAALADRADLATLTVDLRTAAAVVAPQEEKQQQNAFLDGLNSGWEALVASMTVILTVLGALLPLAIVLVLVGGPVLWVLRRRRRPVPPPAPAPAPSPDAGI